MSSTKSSVRRTTAPYEVDRIRFVSVSNRFVTRMGRNGQRRTTNADPTARNVWPRRGYRGTEVSVADQACWANVGVEEKTWRDPPEYDANSQTPGQTGKKKTACPIRKGTSGVELVVPPQFAALCTRVTFARTTMPCGDARLRYPAGSITGAVPSPPTGSNTLCWGQSSEVFFADSSDPASQQARFSASFMPVIWPRHRDINMNCLRIVVIASAQCQGREPMIVP